MDNRCSIKVQLFEDIVEARQNEILDNILNQVVLSGYENKLLAGAILTGGAANMPLMDVAFTKRIKIEKVRIAKETQYTLKGVEISKDGRNNTLIALLANGKENCCLAIPEVIAPKPVAPKPTVTKEPLRSVIEAQLFDEEGESMEAAKKREEEQRQKAKEAALAAEKAAKEAAEAEKRRKTECEELIKEAILLKEEKKYK